MIELNSFFKQPDEIVPISVDYSDVINGTEEIITLTVKAYSMAGVDVTTTLISSSAFTDAICKAIVTAGTSRTKYKLTFVATTDEGNKYEEDLFLHVLSI